ncbi:hypothetical protein NBT05_09415 [Aquimarina sp. ERC-38]|uniref:hypothetical protein n=1 Tax=Aquimarina sp. ERC-38 TaxID=2949996 RepID=UPI002245A6FD|nr:hypothetical protein [Aquimarina sp. ERC-38]UZO79188.1 hypothetical protein NBT05_09415 [Aquimarina sp. ERC-38]
MKYTYYFIIFILLSVGTSYAQKENYLNLTVTGKDSLETSIIREVFNKSKFKSYDSLTTYVSKKIITLQKKGFIDLQKKPGEKISDSVLTITIYLNKKYEHLTIYYDQKQLPIATIKQISKVYTDSTFALPFEKITTSLLQINEFYSNSGNPFTSVTLKNIRKRDSEVTALLQIQKSKQRKTNKVIVKNYLKFPRSFLKYYSGLKNGKTFSKDLIVEKSKLLDNLQFVNNIKEPEVLFTKDSTIVYLYLDKVPANVFDGFIGFSNDSESQDFELNGNINVTLLNNLNFGEELFINYKANGGEQQRFKISTKLPYLFKSPVGINAGLTIFRQDSTFVTTDQQLNLTYQATPKSSITLGYERSTSNSLLDTLAPTNIIDYTSNFVKGGVTYQIPRSHNFFPIKLGIQTSISTGNRNSNNTTINQQKGNFILSYTPALNSRNFIYFENQSALILSDSVFTNELYRFGGLTSIRGFEENSINSSLYSVFRTEYRYLLSSNLYIHSILDFAYFEDNTTNLSSNLSTVGFGIAFNTKTGIFKLQFANGKTDETNFKFSNTKVHLSLLARF